jgi:hypothetical protein
VRGISTPIDVYGKMALKKSELYSSLWSSCDELRGGMDASQYKDYVLVLLFIKYVSDKYAGVPYAPITTVLVQHEMESWRSPLSEYTAIFGGSVERTPPHPAADGGTCIP